MSLLGPGILNKCKLLYTQACLGCLRGEGDLGFTQILFESGGELLIAITVSFKRKNEKVTKDKNHNNISYEIVILVMKSQLHSDTVWKWSGGADYYDCKFKKKKKIGDKAQKSSHDSEMYN